VAHNISDKSSRELQTCHPQLQRLFNEVSRHVNCTIIEGHRGEDLQNKAFKNKKSKVKYPNGKHNSYPSHAVDASPLPIQWDNLKRFYYFAGIVMGIAKMLGIKVRWGGDWDSDLDTKDQNFNDLVHWEIMS